MATNGVIHVIDKLLYPADLPVGNDQLLTILKKLIKYIQIKFVRDSTFKEIPLTFYKINIIESNVQPIIRKEGKRGLPIYISVYVQICIHIQNIYCIYLTEYILYLITPGCSVLCWKSKDTNIVIRTG
ncbi:periostin-like [Meleagris gallopavo]|uniref:periostin-like n=1 Tax=Meleagris gallopavo TaxID=9103 RepID=UPI000549BFBC|nr:periostin-like [Meleagris gallopavo]